MEAVEVLDQRPMERVWTEAKFFSETPDWLKEAMRCDAVSPVAGSDPQAWEVGYHSDIRTMFFPGETFILFSTKPTG